MTRVARAGLDYPAVQAALQMRGYRGKRLASMFADLQVMESAAQAVFDEQFERGPRDEAHQSTLGKR